jgi:AcrR family transcriptional regulator
MRSMSKTRPYVIAVDPGPEDRREHKKARTRDELVQAALGLFSKKGFDATTVEDIAAAAHVSPRTFFRYFANKEEVLFSQKHDDLAALQAGLSGRPAGETPLQAMSAAVLEYMRRFQADRDFHLLRIKLIRESAALEAYALQVHQEWIRYIARILAKRMQVSPITDLRPLLLASCGVVAMRCALVPWVQARGATDICVFARQAFDEIQLGFPG